jgi:hypothetical protein
LKHPSHVFVLLLFVFHSSSNNRLIWWTESKSCKVLYVNLVFFI